MKKEKPAKMKTKTVSIPLPKIEGVELKNATVDLEKGVVVAKYGQEDLYRTTKIGDFLTCLSDPSKTVIFNSIAQPIGKKKVFTILYDLPMQINGKMAYTMTGVKFPFSNFRYSTEEEKALMIEEMEKLGKRYNPKTFEIEDIRKDISEIAVDFESAVDYLFDGIHQFTFSTTKKHIAKLEAFNNLLILAEVWNSFDRFKPDWENRSQNKYYPAFEFRNGKFEFSHASFLRFILHPHASIFNFKSKERAEQFGKQFIELFRIALTN